MDRLPCGSWPTPITSELVVRALRTVNGVAVDGEDVYWSELRPEEGGRTQIVRRDASGELHDLLPEGSNARTAVHEYGGGGWWVDHGTVWYVDWADQRLRRIEPGGAAPAVVADEPAVPRGVRWADGDVHPVDGRLAVVRESHPEGDSPKDVVNEIVTLSSGGAGAQVVVSGPDFVSNPRWSPDGAALCWLQWNHPDMPWDSTELRVRRGDDEEAVAGGPDESIFQPRWADDGSLWFCSDRTDRWTLFRWTPDEGVRRMVDLDAEIGVPQWVFGRSRFDFLADGRVVFAALRDGADTLYVGEHDGSIHRLDVACTSVDYVHANGDRVVLVGSSATEEPAVLRFAVTGTTAAPLEVLSTRRDLGLGPEWFSVPEHIEFPGHAGRPTYAHYYPPTNPDFQPLEDELPPLLVMIHGGPTASADPTLSLGKQYWTSRGFAVADVDYGGSTGYGREYRNRLRGQWGVVDVADCVAVVRTLAEQSRVDPRRAMIRGGSAGGFTTLLALAVSDVFAAGADYFGVADLEALALETHKFESRYLDRLVAPYPEGRDVYAERSALTHVDRITAPLAVFQGAEDAVVPPAQSQVIVEAVRAKGLPVAYELYEGEQHGFRKADNIRASLDGELSFYSQVLGFSLPPGEQIQKLPVENLTGS